MNNFLDECRSAIGANHVLTDDADTAAYLTDWRRRFTGKALAVVKPASADEVAAIVRLCNEFQIPVVPQGGNTGLVLGSVPDDSGSAIVLSLTRLNRIRAIDLVNNTMTVEAGCILEHIQNAASESGRLFPLSLAAEGSCTIGGNLATNAGGTGVLRYGNARDLCLGLEVVTPQGELWSGLRGLRKDNTGYDLRDLFIGAEGSLGIITAAVLKLFPQPKARLTALATMQTADDALQLLSIAQTQCGAALTGFELMSDFCLQLVSKHFPQMQLPFPQHHPQYVLLELSDNESEEHAMAMLENVITSALEEDVIQDAVVAASIAQSKSLWNLREHIPLAQAEEGKNIKHDVSVPISCIGDFIRETDILLQKDFPACRMVTFGHLGDGNLHYNISPPENASDQAFIARQEDVNLVVHDSVHRFGGSISAEHGLGALKRDEICRYKSDIEMNLMRSIKRALDPMNLMNPGKVL
ncbi:MAG: FAD-binding oxidoreductase [Herminiimonas sp.]|nr:FAD-binding oxidoreductase [Herminiimonas sp.]